MRKLVLRSARYRPGRRVDLVSYPVVGDSHLYAGQHFVLPERHDGSRDATLPV